MADFQYNLVRDGKGGQIKFPIFISQADMDLIEKNSSQKMAMSLSSRIRVRAQPGPNKWYIFW